MRLQRILRHLDIIRQQEPRRKAVPDVVHEFRSIFAGQLEHHCGDGAAEAGRHRGRREAEEARRQRVRPPQGTAPFVVRREEQPLHVFLDAFGGDFVDSADQREDGGDGVVEFGLGVCDDGVVEDVDEVLGVAFLVEGGEDGVHSEEFQLLAFLVFEIEVYEGVDEVVDRRFEGRGGDLAADQNLEDVGD